MAKFLTEYFENYDRSFDELEKEGLNLDDLFLKSKFLFMNGKYTFSSKSKFNLGSKTSANHEYGLKHKCHRGTIDLKHKASGETSIETETKCLEKDDFALYTYSKFVLDQGEDRRNCNSNLMFRIHHKNKGLVSLGFENWNPCAGSPNTISAYGSYGHLIDNNKVTFNGYFNYDIQNKFLPLAKFFIKGQKGNVSGYFQTNIKRNQISTDDAENPKITNQAIDTVLKIVSQVDSKTKLGSVFKYDLETKKSEVALLGSHIVDRVRFNGKLSTDRSLVLGITSSFDDITLNFAAKSTLHSVAEEVGETKQTRHFVKYKFGMTAEFNRI